MFIQKVRNIKRLLPLLTALLLLTGIGAQAQSDLGWIGVKIERWPARPWADGSYTGVTDAARINRSSGSQLQLSLKQFHAPPQSPGPAARRP